MIFLKWQVSPIVEPPTHTPLKLHSHLHIFGVFCYTKSCIGRWLRTLRQSSRIEGVLLDRLLQFSGEKVLTLLKKSFSYTFLCTKSIISLRLMCLGHGSMIKDTQTVKTNEMSPLSTPHLNSVTREVLTFRLSQYIDAPMNRPSSFWYLPSVFILVWPSGW